MCVEGRMGLMMMGDWDRIDDQRLQKWIEKVEIIKVEQRAYRGFARELISFWLCHKEQNF
jgi:hypothetical protein